MYTYSIGIIDVALKLFMAVQMEAIFDGSETITEQSIQQAWERHFTLIDPIVAAYKLGDAEALEHYQDITPIDFESLLADLKGLYQGPRDPIASLRPGDEHFAPAIAQELVNSGMDARRALQVAKRAEAKAKTKNVHEATKAALTENNSSGNRPSNRKTKTASDVTAPDLPPDDYRLAIRAARVEDCSVFSKLKTMGAVFDLDAFLVES